MFDTHEIVRTLTAANLTPVHVDAITDAVRAAADRGDYATGADLIALELPVGRVELSVPASPSSERCD